ncbi:hypothetical protein B0H19DRAFT_100351 [Mycena capillaripes]|nr:hypothetical protein B0H19DRAFT_100351 [Mycena capillaripes]
MITTPAQPWYVHADLAVDILLALTLYDSDRRNKSGASGYLRRRSSCVSGEDQEILCTLFSHLHIEGTLPSPLLVKLSCCSTSRRDTRSTALDKAVGRFKSRITADFAADLAEVTWAEYWTPEMRELYEFIGIDVLDWADGCVGRSLVAPTDEDDQHRHGDGPAAPPESPVPSKSRKGKAPTKRPHSKPAPPPTENSEQDSDASEEDEAPPPSPSPMNDKPLSHPQLKATRRRASKAPLRKMSRQFLAHRRNPRSRCDRSLRQRNSRSTLSRLARCHSLTGPPEVLRPARAKPALEGRGPNRHQRNGRSSYLDLHALVPQVPKWRYPLPQTRSAETRSCTRPDEREEKQPAQATRSGRHDCSRGSS